MSDTIELTDEFHQEEPLGYLVKNHDTTIREYEVFAEEYFAQEHARQQEQLARDAGEEEDWQIFPMYASHAI